MTHMSRLAVQGATSPALPPADSPATSSPTPSTTLEPRSPPSSPTPVVAQGTPVQVGYCHGGLNCCHVSGIMMAICLGLCKGEWNRCIRIKLIAFRQQGRRHNQVKCCGSLRGNWLELFWASSLDYSLSCSSRLPFWRCYCW